MIANIEQTKQLIQMYKSITLSQIEELWNKPKMYSVRPRSAEVAHSITGFSDGGKCILCSGVACYECIHTINDTRVFKYSCSFHNTYSKIDSATTPSNLLTAFGKRAEYLESLLTKYYNSHEEENEIKISTGEDK